MDTNIHIRPVRGRVPRRYEVTDRRTVQQRLRSLAALCAFCAAFWGCVYLWATW